MGLTVCVILTESEPLMLAEATLECEPLTVAVAATVSVSLIVAVGRVVDDEDGVMLMVVVGVSDEDGRTVEDIDELALVLALAEGIGVLLTEPDNDALADADDDCDCDVDPDGEAGTSYSQINPVKLDASESLPSFKPGGCPGALGPQ